VGHVQDFDQLSTGADPAPRLNRPPKRQTFRSSFRAERGRAEVLGRKTSQSKAPSDERATSFRDS
jgi:hypothetical protein